MGRDIEGDYKRAYVDEHAALVRAGRAESAERVAGILRDEFGYDIDDGGKRLETAAAQPPLEDAAEQRVSDDEHGCDYCDFVAKSAAGLANHERAHHSDAG